MDGGKPPLRADAQVPQRKFFIHLTQLNPGLLKRYEICIMPFCTTLLGLLLCLVFDRGQLWRSLQNELVMPATDERYDTLEPNVDGPLRRLCKVRCNSCQPCGNCSQAGLSCTYDAIPQKKGPKGSRAKVISELRETQKHSDLAQIQPGSSGCRSPPDSPAYTPTSGLLTPQLTDACAEFFFAHMYPTMPILHRDQIRIFLETMEHSVELYCLVTALCAFMLIQPGIASHMQTLEEPNSSTTNPKMGASLIDEVVRVRKSYDYIENPTVHTVITSFFLFGSCFGLNKHNAGWCHLREATALAQILGMQDENTYLFGGPLENARNRRLFWLLFVTERSVPLDHVKSISEMSVPL